MSRPKILTDVVGAFNAMQRVASASGLTLVEEKGCTQPKTCLKTGRVYVPELGTAWDRKRVLKWEGETHHEIGHHAPEVQDTLPFMEEKNLSFNSLFGSLMNVFDDIRNEYNNRGMYPGRCQALSFIQAFYCMRGAMELAKSDPSDIDKDSALMRDVLSWVYLYRSDWQHDLAIPAQEFAKHADPDQFKVLSSFLPALSTIQDVYDLTCKILEVSENHNPEEEEGKSREAKAKAKKEKSESAEGEEGEGEDSGEGKKEGEGEGEDEAKGKLSYKDLMGHTHTDDAKGNPYMSIDYDHDPRYDYVPYRDKISVAKARHGKYSDTASKKIIKEYNKGRSLASVARRLFQSRTQSKTSHNNKSGRLDKRDLYRIPQGNTDVFKRKISAVDPKGTAVFLLTDHSGSMSGDKYNVTAASAALLAESITPLGVPLEIAAFSEACYVGLDHYIIKEFNEKRSSADIIRDYSSITCVLRQNADGESIMWAAKRLMARPEERKILIVLSDGEPCCDNPGDAWTYTRDVIHTLSSKVELYGIGILSDAVQDLFPEYTVLSNTAHLEKCLLEVIKKKIFTN